MIDPRISLAAQTPDISNTLQMFNNSLNSAQNRRSNQQFNQQQAALLPGQLQAQQQNIDINQSAMNTQAENENLISIGATIPQLRGFISNGDNLGALSFLNSRNQDLIAQGRSEQERAETLDAIEIVTNGNLDQLGQELDVVEQLLSSRGLGAQPATRFATKPAAPQVDQETGEVFQTVFDPNTNTSRRVNIEGATQPTESQQRESRAQSELGIEQGKSDIRIRENKIKDANQISKEAFQKIPAVKGQVKTINNAIQAIDQGGSSGFMQNIFPSFRESTLDLQNNLNQMGLDVVSATTFGALSEGELRLAMDVAAPRNLQPKALKSWLTERRDAKKKLIREYEKMAVALGGNVTISDYLEKNATFAEIGSQQSMPQTPQPQSQAVGAGASISSMSIDELIAERARLAGK
jgi:hypothetical protein